MNITAAQEKALEKFVNGDWLTAHEAHEPYRLLLALRDMGYLESYHRQGYLYTPEHSILFKIRK